MEENVISTIDLNEYDKSNFKCFKFPDNSIYFGEIAYIDPTTHAIVFEQDLDSLPEEKVKSLRLIRHGVGSMLFCVEGDDFMCKYEGEWAKDKKNGRGLGHFPDKSVYEGSFVNDLFEGHGKYAWPKGDCYIGQWKNGCMEGEGEFRHCDGHILKGVFKNNYHFDKERFCNPFLPLDELELFRTKNLEYTIKKQKQNEKFSRANIYKISNQQELIRSIEESIKNNKTPLILRSRESLKKRSEIFKLLIKEFKEFDLRYYYNKLKESLLNNEVFEEIHKFVTETITRGLYLVLNFDDCSIRYDEVFDPDINEFYGKMMLSPFMWTPALFAHPKCWQSHLNNNSELKFDKNFKFLVYSKFIIDPELQEHDLINVIEKRFEKSFSLLNVNVLILTNFK